MNGKECGRKQFGPNLRYYTGTYLDRSRKTIETLTQND
jgi:hypothetical protein